MVERVKEKGVYIEERGHMNSYTHKDTFQVSYYITLIGMLACCYSVTPWTPGCTFWSFVGGGSIQRKKVDALSIIYIGGKGVH